MNKKIIYLIFSISFLFFVFFLLEERNENQTEVSYWKENWKVIRFAPPKETWCGKLEPSFINSPFQIQMYDRGWKKSPIFTVSFIDPETKNVILYEGNYNVKNTFSDLSVLKTKFIEPITEEHTKAHCLTGDGPRLILSKDYADLKSELGGSDLIFGKKLESDTSRIITKANDKIISPYNYILDKFRGKLDGIRERQYISYNGGYLTHIEFSGQGQLVRAENSAKKNQYETYVNQWSRPTGERIVFSPAIGNDWETKLKALRADMYPDESSGPGFLKAQEFKKGQPEFTISSSHSDAYRWKLLVYSKFKWNDLEYRPVVREITGYFTEDVSFVKEDTFQNFVKAAMEVKNASRFERPNQKIQ
ncbi:MAG: hypothetical protein SH817_04175 [Leptospira sp.]|nr:hypothetical protein [Leptospira sp.]